MLEARAITLDSRLILRIAQLWLALLAFNLLRLTLAWLTSRRLIAHARTLHSSIDSTFLAACASRLKIPTPEVLLLPESATIPVVAGILRPVLLLPPSLEHDYELTAVLLHEFAHIRRRDTLANLLCRLVALPIAWHPVTPLFQARINQTREILCDAIAARAAGSSTAYARSLLTLARDIHHKDIHLTLATLGLFSSKPFRRSPFHSATPLEERIMKLITPQVAIPANRTARSAAGIALAVAATWSAAAFHLQTVAAAQRPAAIATFLPVSSATISANGWQPGPSLMESIPAPSSSDHGGIIGLSIEPEQDAISPPVSPAPPALPTAALPTLPALAPLSPLAPLPALPPAVPQQPAAPAPTAVPEPAPSPIPSPSPAPTPHPRHTAIVDGVQRDLTPEESTGIDKQLAAAQRQINRALSQHLVDEQQLKIQLKSLNMPELDRQMASLRKQLQSPEFQKQIADAQKLAIDHAMNSEEFKQQLDRAAQQIKIAQAQMATEHIDIKIDQTQMQQQIKAATDALAHSRIDVHINTAQIQKQLEESRRQIEEARRNLTQSHTSQPE